MTRSETTVQPRHLQTLGELLRQRTGMDPGLLHTATVERAFTRRLNHAAPGEMLEKLRASNHDFNAFVEEIVVPESWFFRDREPFVHLRNWVAERRPHLRRRLRILSAPCASGEEPYSIAMILLDLGLSPRDFRIDAYDISLSALQKAKAGVFRPRALRGTPPVTGNYLDQRAHEIVVHPNVISAVHFHHGNMVDPEFLKNEPVYDAIFCRNVLIYFDAAAREQVGAVLARELDPQGVLYVGHADPVQVLLKHFEAVPHARSFAYVRRAAARPMPHTRTGRASKTSTLLAVKTGHTAKAAAQTARKSAVGSTHDQAATKRLIEKAQAFADAGKLEDAAVALRSALDRDGLNAKAWHLLGMVQEARKRDADAEAAFNKALYLAPDQIETLEHLAMILERRGRSSEAALLRSRARRAGKARGASA